MSSVGLAEASMSGAHGETRGTSGCVMRLRKMALAALARMYRRDRQVFAFRLRRVTDEDRLEGVSGRYTAIALLGLAGEDEAAARAALGGDSIHDVCGRLIGERVADGEELGEVALGLWSARVLGHPKASAALERLQTMRPDQAECATVELSWALSSLIADCEGPGDAGLAERIAQRLMASFNSASNLFPHWPVGVRASWWRRHVTCFADKVYPIQALSLYHRATGDARALELARKCADHMCAMQGEAGQWWWHFDVRTGRVIEKYPVYAIHQDAMGPMALHELREAGGGDSLHEVAVERSLAWLERSPELNGDSLIDERAGVIWRKVARHEPGKLSRQLQAAASRVSSGLRMPVIGAALRPGWIDDESRPYHMGWLLYAWSERDQEIGI